MSVVTFLTFGSIGTIFSWATWAVVLTQMNPDTGHGLPQIMFFVSLWMALLGTATVLGFLARHFFEHQAVPYRQMTIAARQALNFSLVAIALLGLQATHSLSIWSALLVFLLAIGTEGFFVAGQARYHRPGETGELNHA